MDIQERIEQLKRAQFLQYIVEKAHGNTAAMVKIGDAGEALGLPYEEAIRISDGLVTEGLIRRVGRFDPPHGPAVQITDAGFRVVAA